MKFEFHSSKEQIPIYEIAQNLHNNKKSDGNITTMRAYMNP
jgi:hypothetical protein